MKGCTVFDWLRKKVPFVGSVLFRGREAIQAHEFDFLREKEITITRGDESPDLLWSLRLEHPRWGRANLECMQDQHAPGDGLFDVVQTLTPRERQEARAAGTEVILRTESRSQNLLRERKNALRFLQAIMGEDGLAVVDYLAQSVWSREMLQDELLHNADLDIEQIYAVHAVMADGREEVSWVHTHGLAEIGFFDFDIVDPSPDLFLNLSDLMRMVSFAILEKQVRVSTDRFAVFSPGGNVRFVPAEQFNRKAPEACVRLRDPDPSHNDRRAVLCEPAGLLNFWGRKVRPARTLSGSIPNETLIHFSTSASRLMAHRARQTYPMLRRYFTEFMDIGFPVLAKLGFEADDGKDKDDLEHLWFSVHALYDDRIEATLENSPVAVKDLKMGHRGTFPVSRLSDWVILTPLGAINPRNSKPARLLRQEPELMEKVTLTMRDNQAQTASSATGNS